MRVARGVEFVVLFFGAVGGYALLGSPGSPIPVLLVAGGLAFWHLRRRPGVVLWGAAGLRPALRPILLTWAAAAVVGIAVVAAFRPAHLFDLPRETPWLWLAVAVFYPLFSVYPQEVLFRAFLLDRYAPVFGTGWAAAAASAVAFGFAHVIFGSIWSVLLTLAGGALFARRYQRTRSLLAVCVEHSLYGVLAFTIGLGDLFYHAA
ncbi:CAAX protease self-immunity [Asanoa ishikariensis]|uniref:CAAX protease self-immunity n=1 Tax=Asanoa ishikariensis TaxID=137265 RepID=A0A1H3T1Q7_9ACTN|nr:CPBP family glutamic-type intramembrane protease [Asanoa ishikariensis]SDZ44172.1 CAAX protease self-immunity [Asanoa ishikariensis]